MKTEGRYIRKEFKRHDKLFKQHLENVSQIQNYQSVWSNSYLDFAPFETEISQSQKPKIFETKPKEPIGKIENRFKDGKLFYAHKFKEENWGTAFYLNEEDNKIRLKYVYDDEKEKMALQQIEILIISENSNVEKGLFYMRDDENDEETFFFDKYLYTNEQQLISIERNGYYEEKDNILPTIIFRFEYDNENIKIYAKQQKLNAKNQEEQIYPKTR